VDDINFDTKAEEAIEEAIEDKIKDIDIDQMVADAMKTAFKDIANNL
jgi:hypothetical protein